MWTTGASVRRYSWLDGEEYDEVLSLDEGAVRLERLNLGAPFLDTHCSYALENVIGSIVPESARIEGGKGLATVKLSQSERAADTVRDIKDGVIRNISVGYWIHKVVKTEGTDAKIARWDVVDWEPLEVSAVPIPADPGSQVRSETANDGSGPATRSCTFVTKSPAAAPTKESRMATRKPAAATRGKKKTVAELTVENERLAALLAAAKRDEDKKDEDEDERDEDDEDKKDKDSDGERDDNDDDKRKDDEDSDDERDGDDADEEDDCEDEDDKRAAPSSKSVRAAAEAAVKKERERSAEITAIAERANLPKLGRKHIDKGTTVRAFKTILLERMLAKQEKDAPIRGVSADEDVVRVRGSAKTEERQYAEGAAHWRKVAGKAEAKA